MEVILKFCKVIIIIMCRISTYQHTVELILKLLTLFMFNLTGGSVTRFATVVQWPVILVERLHCPRVHSTVYR